VPFEVDKGKTPPYVKWRSVQDSVQTWVKLDGCDEKPKTEVLSKDGDELKVTRTTYGAGKAGAEVVLITIDGGGHTWPGMTPPASFLGKSALSISANNLMWEFFQKHRLQ
jgi:polyhydroxybutyrate depolymerase